MADALTLSVVTPSHFYKRKTIKVVMPTKVVCCTDFSPSFLLFLFKEIPYLIQAASTFSLQIFRNYNSQAIFLIFRLSPTTRCHRDCPDSTSGSRIKTVTSANNNNGFHNSNTGRQRDA